MSTTIQLGTQEMLNAIQRLNAHATTNIGALLALEAAKQQLQTRNPNAVQWLTDQICQYIPETCQYIGQLSGQLWDKVDNILKACGGGNPAQCVQALSDLMSSPFKLGMGAVYQLVTGPLYMLLTWDFYLRNVGKVDPVLNRPTPEGFADTVDIVVKLFLVSMVIAWMGELLPGSGVAEIMDELIESVFENVFDTALTEVIDRYVEFYRGADAPDDDEIRDIVGVDTIRTPEALAIFGAATGMSTDGVVAEIWTGMLQGLQSDLADTRRMAQEALEHADRIARAPSEALARTMTEAVEDIHDLVTYQFEELEDWVGAIWSRYRTLLSQIAMRWTSPSGLAGGYWAEKYLALDAQILVDIYRKMPDVVDDVIDKAASTAYSTFLQVRDVYLPWLKAQWVEAWKAVYRTYKGVADSIVQSIVDTIGQKAALVVAGLQKLIVLRNPQ